MWLEELGHTCSMRELCNVVPADLKDKTELIKRLSQEGEPPLKIGIKSLIYNCKDRKLTTGLKRLGFKKVNQYTGNDNNHKGKKVTIHTFVMNTTRELDRDVKKQIAIDKKLAAEREALRLKALADAKLKQIELNKLNNKT